MTAPSPIAPARMRWTVAEQLPDQVREQIIGPGAPFELRDEVVLGSPVTVFANRPRHAGAMLTIAAQRYADRPYVVFPTARLSFAEFEGLARRTAGHLVRRYGIGRGDRVAVASANSLPYVVTFWAVALAGGINVGLNGWWTGNELRYGIDLSEPSLLLADAVRRDRLIEAGVDPATIVDLDSFLDDVAASSAGATGDADVDPDASIDEDDPLLILFTSGTTGRPKGATLTHRNFIHHTLGVQLQTVSRLALAGLPPELPPPGSSICASPLFHVSGAFPLLSYPLNGTTMIFPPPGRWDERRHLELTQEHRITNWSGVPTQFWRLLQHPDFDRFDLSSLRTAGGGGATYPPELIRLFAVKLPHVVLGTGYGLSESAGFGASIGGDLYRQHPDALGMASPTSEIEIRDEGDRPLPEGEIGQICMRHAAVFRGYWRDDAATKEALDGDRWLRTGDYGRIENGMLYLESRMRDLIIRGGENIYPIEIENRLVEHPDIDDAAVIGVDHQVLGQEVKACVVVRDGTQLTADDVRVWVAATHARFKVPEHVEFLDALPRTANGKVMKHVLERPR